MSINNSFKIKVVKKPEKAEWDSFIESSNEVNPFLMVDFLELHNQKVCYITALDEQGKLIGVIAGRVRGDKPIIGLLSKILWLDSGPVVTHNDNSQKNRIKVALLESLIKECKKLGVIKITCSHWVREENPEIFTKAGFKKTTFATFLIDLSLSEEELFSNLKRDNRRIIRNTLKENIRVFHYKGNKSLEYLDKLHELHTKIYKRATTEHSDASMSLRSEDYIEKVLNLDSHLSIAVLDDQILAWMLMLPCGKGLFPYMAGRDVDFPLIYGVSTLLWWEIICFAKKAGFKIYDLGGAPVDPTKDDPAYGVYIFKKGFGGEYCKYYGGVYIIKPFKYKLLQKVLANKRIVRYAFKILKGKL